MNLKGSGGARGASTGAGGGDGGGGGTMTQLFEPKGSPASPISAMSRRLASRSRRTEPGGKGLASGASAAMAGLWAIVIGAFIYRNLGFKTLIAIFAMSARQSAVVMMLIASSFIVNYAITSEQVAVQLAAYIASLNLSAIVFMLLVNVMFLILGTVLDGAVMLLVFVPVLLPTVNALGIDLVQFGVVVILNFMIAMITPPYGLILFVLGSLTGVPMKEINREIWQFCIPLSVVMFLMIFFPSITLWLPRQFGYVG